MTLTELKQRIHDKVDDSNDVELLERIDALVSQKEEVFQIPEYMLKGVRQGIEDIKNRNVYSQKDFEKKYEKWLKG